MNENTTRGLLVTGLGANVLFLMLALLDFSLAASKFMWPIFVGWAFVIMLMVILSLAASGIRVRLEQTKAAVPVRTPARLVFNELPPQAAGKATGPFRFNDYTLYSRNVTLKNGGTRPIYFFAKSKPVSGNAIAKPTGFHVGVNERTGLPFLKRGDGPDGEDLTPALPDSYRPQCGALTDEGHQCRNSSRADSKYCASHFGYRPPVMAQAAAKREDTLPRVKEAPDTVPTVRRVSA